LEDILHHLLKDEGVREEAVKAVAEETGMSVDEVEEMVRNFYIVGASIKVDVEVEEGEAYTPFSLSIR